MLYGRDVSNFQGKFAWASVAPKPAFGFCKATEGVSFVDSYCPWNWGELKRLGMLRGAYHFGHPGEAADAQAQLFVKTVQKAGGLAASDVLVLDLEVTDGKGPAAVASWADEFVKEVGKLTGKNCWVYTDHSFIQNGACAGLYSHPLWIAAPGTAGKPGSVAPWAVWSAHQYGTVGGVDADVFDGTAATWSKLANLSAPPKPPAPKPPATKVVATAYTANGKQTIKQISEATGTAPSTLLRMTCEHAANGLFDPYVAGYLNTALPASTAVVKAGTVFWYPKTVPVS